MAIEYVSYDYIAILYESLVVSIATYGCELWSVVTRNMTTTTQHDTFYKDMLRKELGVSRLCPNDLLYEISGKIPLSYQIWKRRLAFFIQGINSSADSIIMQGMVELHDIEKQNDITPWLADTMRMVAYIDPSAQLKSQRIATGDWVLRIK